MKMFFIFLLVVFFGITFSPTEGRRRITRQIWPVPNIPNYYWDGSESRDSPEFYDNGDFWLGPARFDQPPRNQNNFNFGGDTNDRNQNRRRTTTTTTTERTRDSFNSGGSGNNRRTTTEALGPITSTPITIHYAPRGCKCPMTQQFNPVCGTDGNTYRNQGLLNCYQRCGTNVSLRRMGSC